MAGGKSKKAVRSARGSVVQQRSIPWIMIAGCTVVLLLAVGIFGYVFTRWSDREAAEAEQAKAEQATAMFKPSPRNPDPSKNIPGVQMTQYPAQIHVGQQQRVAYDKKPPYGGPHDGVWAACTGTVYDTPVRNENMVHSLEHGAVWITYNPTKVDQPSLDRLKTRVEGKPYTMLSPYPGMDSPISLQSWGHQLKVNNANDPRIDQFITALRQNNHGVYPEIGGACQAYPGLFDPRDPPPFQGGPPPPGAVTMDGKGAQQAPGPMSGPR